MCLILKLRQLAVRTLQFQGALRRLVLLRLHLGVCEMCTRFEGQLRFPLAVWPLNFASMFGLSLGEKGYAPVGAFIDVIHPECPSTVPSSCPVSTSSPRVP